MHLNVIIPAHNEEANLDILLGHLTKCTTNLPVEIRVVLSADTTDNSAAICDKYGVNYLNSSATQRSMQMNEGARLSTSPWLFFLHADVTLPTDFTELIRKELQHNEAGFFNYEFDKLGFGLKFNASFVKKKGVFTGGGDQCHFLKKSTFEKLGGYNEEYCIMEDFELIDRIKKNKIPYSIIETPVIVSARKYEKNSWLKVSLINGYVFLLYKLGASPQRLQRGYKRLLRD